VVAQVGLVGVLGYYKLTSETAGTSAELKTTPKSIEAIDMIELDFNVITRPGTFRCPDKSRL
jgi:hypothetical protein